MGRGLWGGGCGEGLWGGVVGRGGGGGMGMFYPYLLTLTLFRRSFSL